MALSAILDTIDGLNDEVKGHYAEIKDGPNAGKFRLDVTPVSGLTLEDTSGLKSALQETRTERDRLKDRVKALGDLDVSEVKSKLEKLAELEAIDPTKEADKIADQKAQAKLDRLERDHRARMQAKDIRINQLEGTVRKVSIQDAASRAITRANGNAALLLPHVISSLDLELGEDGNVAVFVKDGFGNRRVKSSGADMGIEDFVAELRASDDFASAFKASGQTGGGTVGSDGKAPRFHTNEPRKSEMSFAQRGAFISAHGLEAFQKLKK